MKKEITRQELERAYNEINRCPCCGITPDEIKNQYPYDGSHSCGCSPEVFLRVKDKIEVEIDD